MRTVGYTWCAPFEQLHGEYLPARSGSVRAITVASRTYEFYILHKIFLQVHGIALLNEGGAWSSTPLFCGNGRHREAVCRPRLRSFAGDVAERTKSSRYPLLKTKKELAKNYVLMAVMRHARQVTGIRQWTEEDMTISGWTTVLLVVNGPRSRPSVSFNRWWLSLRAKTV